MSGWLELGHLAWLPALLSDFYLGTAWEILLLQKEESGRLCVAKGKECPLYIPFPSTFPHPIVFRLRINKSQYDTRVWGEPVPLATPTLLPILTLRGSRQFPKLHID